MGILISMKRIILILLSFVGIILIQSCQRPVYYLPPSEYLLYTNKSQSQVISDLRMKLKSENYEISRIDYVTGIMGTKPRYFYLGQRNGEARGEQIVTVHQETGSVKLRMQYQCDYTGTGDHWTTCSVYDMTTIKKIEKLENLLLPVVSAAIHKATEENPEPPLSPRSQVRGHFRTRLR